MRTLVDDVVLVEDDRVREAMRLLIEHTGLVIEPSGAVGVAAILSTPERFQGMRIATVLCGGNVTRDQMPMLTGGPVRNAG